MALVEAQVHNRILELKLNFNEKNTGTKEGVNALIELLDHYEQDRNVRVLILSSAVEGNYSSGMEPAHLVGKSREEIEDMLTPIIGVFTRLFLFERPTIAQITGHALATGAVFALACDYRFMADKPGRIGFSEALISMSVTPAPLLILSELIGPNKAREILFSGQRLKARDAKEMGFIDEVYPAAELKEKTWKKAEKLAALTYESARGMKRSFIQPYRKALAAVDPWGVAHMAETTMTNNAQEGLKSVLEGRPPVFDS